ncbi:MAG: ABC transporter permease [Myxococcota bacterium]
MSLRNGAIAQLRVINAMALRETRTRFGQHRLGYVWALVEPLTFIAMFAGMYAIVGRTPPGGMGIIPFLTTGILTYQFFAKTADQGAAAIDANRALLYYPQVQTLDLILARTALEAATYGVAFALIMGSHALWVGQLTIDSALTVLWAFLLASMLGMSLGLLLCGLGVVSKTVDRIRGPLMRPLFWTSGLFYTANGLPSGARDILLYNPVLHCVEVARAGWFPSYEAHHANPTYVLVWILGFAFFGLTLERTVRRKVQLT